MTGGRDDRLLQRLLATFKQEARERIAAMAVGIGELGSTVGEARVALVEMMFREAHSLKAAAQSVGQKEIELLCQPVESVFAALKRGEATPSQALLAELQAAADMMEDLSAAIDATPSPTARSRAASLNKSLGLALEQARSAPRAPPAPEPQIGISTARGSSVPDASSRPSAPAVVAAPPPASELPRDPARVGPAPPAAAPDTVRLSVHRLDALLRQTEEMLPEKLAARRLSEVLGQAVDAFSEWKKERTKLREVIEHRHRSMPGRTLPAEPLTAFLEQDESRMRALGATLATAWKTADAEARRLGPKVDALLRDMKDILTLPGASVLQALPRVIRELAREQAKDVAIVIHGGDLEIDRRVLQELKDPLLHLVRNCVDHGIELPRDREAAGKPAQATITLSIASREGDKAEFVVMDDGAGIATGKLAAAATKLGLVAAERAEADDTVLLPLIFQSGLSTSPMITDVSGRGLGLAIVREKVERLGGRVSVESTPGHGTTFRLVVPLSLATYRGILVRVAERLFVFPTLGVERVVGVERTAVSTVENRAMLDVGGVPVPLVSLRDVLEMGAPPAGALRGRRIEAVVVGAAGRPVAFEVDSVEGDQEILVKPLGKCLVRVRNVQGATILPTGALAPILNIQDLLKSAKRVATAAPPQERPPEAGRMARRILVVEDSITARGLLRSILEAAGYRVRTAVDGMDAWAALTIEPFDLVVSDIEMPRMNGFELTARIRDDKRLAELPVVLVSALQSPEDRERGVDVGANAYILKGGFEQGMLLEAVDRLI